MRGGRSDSPTDSNYLLRTTNPPMEVAPDFQAFASHPIRATDLSTKPASISCRQIGDKGYDSKELRAALRKRGIRPQLPKRVWKTKKNRGRPIKISVPRFQQERCFAWFQRKYRRLVVRWERISACFNAFLSLATIHIWLNRILLVG